MKKLRVGVGILLAGIMIFSGLSLSQAAPDATTMTNAELASMLVGILGLKMPDNANTLSDEELFEVQANMLAERGIAQFVGVQPDAVVIKGLIANLLYDALMGPNSATTEEKINYLAGLGYITEGNANDVVTRAEIITALNIPALSGAIVEAYSPPVGAPAGGLPPAPANPSLEGPSTAI